ncbi:MAG TPA: hypothetical protein VFY45_26430 [Baekduia sp.]|nr:hypothetical protein [Baekduia sp.]
MKKFLILTAATIFVALGAQATAASAAMTNFVRVGAFASQGINGQAHHRGRIAVNHATGDVYVTDQQHDRVDVYRQNGPSADLLTSFGSGALTDPYGIAIDQGDGTVYVADQDGVTKFNSNNAATPAFTADNAFGPVTTTGPLAFDQSANVLLLADTTANVVRRYSTAGVAGPTFNGTGSPDTFGTGSTFTRLQDIAVDSTGDVIVIDTTSDPGTGGTSRIERFNAAGVWQATIGPVAQAATLGVVPADDEVIVGGNQDGVDRNESPTLSRFSSAGVDLGTFAADASIQYSTTSGIAADDGATGRLHVATDVSAGNWTGAYGLTSVQNYELQLLATVTAAPATAVAPFSATLHGTVNPEGGATTYRFEISADGGVSWSDVDEDGDGLEDAGSGSADVAVSETATGLVENTSYLFRLTARRGLAPSASGTAPFTTTDADDPTAAIAPTSDVNGSSATFHGAVNPQGGPGDSSYFFEYSADGGGTWEATPAQAAGQGTADVPATATVSALRPVTSYQVRLVVKKGSITTTSDVDTFLSGVVVPSVAAVKPVAVGSERALLAARVTPQGSPTTFWVEYGPTVAYGSASPVAKNGDVGSGHEPVLVQRTVTGLSPGTTYHFRVVAHNVAGATFGSDQTFVTAATPSGNGNGRVYEQVSPASKNFASVAWQVGAPGYGLTLGARDGNAAVFTSWGVFAGSENGLIQTYRSRRTAAGWVTTPGAPALTVDHPDAVINPAVPAWTGATPDLEHGLMTTSNAWSPDDTNSTRLIDGAPPEDQIDVYVRRPDDTTELMSRNSAGIAVGHVGDYGNSADGQGLSRDGSTVVFTTSSHAVPADAARPNGVRDLYARRAGRTQLVGVRSDGTSVDPACGSALAGLSLVPAETGASVSTDGRRIVFETPYPGLLACSATPRQLYVRVDGSRTAHASASQRHPADPAGTQSAAFVTASSDGTRVLFTTREMLTDDTPSNGQRNLYAFQVDTGSLTLLYQGELNVVASSADATHVFFTARDALAAENLYALSGDHLTTVAAPQVGGVGADAYGSVSSADGRSLLFVASGDLVGFDAHGYTEVYLYREGQGLTCVSCGTGSTPPTSSARIAIGRPLSGGSSGEEPNRYASSLSTDGNTVAFDTREALVASDTNNKYDVYEWRNGRLLLVSRGHDSTEATLIGMSRDSTDIFFTTADPMVAQDTDGGDVDVYDARLGGGFPEGSGTAVMAPCVGDACQGPVAAPAPPAAPAGSLTFVAADPVLTPRSPGASVKVSRLRATTGTAATLKVKVPGAGSIAVAGAQVIGDRRSATKAATYAVKVGLTAKAKASLKSKKTLKVAVKVTFTAKAGDTASTRLTLTFKQPKAKRRSAASSKGAH